MIQVWCRSVIQGCINLRNDTLQKLGSEQPLNSFSVLGFKLRELTFIITKLINKLHRPVFYLAVVHLLTISEPDSVAGGYTTKWEVNDCASSFEDYEGDGNFW